MRYLDPKYDLPFKRVFGQHAHLLKSFLNALLPLPEDQPIVELEYLPAEQVPELPGLFKNSIVDVKCKDSAGRSFIVEMQMLWTPSFEQCMVFSASQAYVKQLQSGQGYQHLGQVYALALVDEVFDASANYYHHYKIVRQQSPERVLKGLEFVFIELPKFKAQTQTDKRVQALWLRFMNLLENPPDDMNALVNAPIPELQQAIKLVEVGAYTPAELEGYHKNIDQARVESTLINESLAKGRAEGRVEERLDIARRLKAQGVQASLIAQATDLDLPDIEGL